MYTSLQSTPWKTVQPFITELAMPLEFSTSSWTAHTISHRRELQQTFPPDICEKKLANHRFNPWSPSHPRYHLQTPANKLLALFLYQSHITRINRGHSPLIRNRQCRCVSCPVNLIDPKEGPRFDLFASRIFLLTIAWTLKTICLCLCNARKQHPP